MKQSGDIHGLGAFVGISGASAPASLKPLSQLTSLVERGGISGASAPASLKHGLPFHFVAVVAGYFRGIRPGLIEAANMM